MEDQLGFEKRREATPRSFGLLMAGVCSLLGVWALFRENPMAWALLPVASLLAGLALVAPALLKPWERGWMWLAEWVGRVGNTVLLTAFFLLVLTPFGVALRLFRRDRLRLRTRSRSTYWEPVETERSTYFDPF